MSSTPKWQLEVCNSPVNLLICYNHITGRSAGHVVRRAAPSYSSPVCEPGSGTTVETVLAVDETDIKTVRDGSVVAVANTEIQLRLLGQNLNRNVKLLISQPGNCNLGVKTLNLEDAEEISPDGRWTLITVTLPYQSEPYGFCVRSENSTGYCATSQDPWNLVLVESKFLLPLWVQILFIVLLLMLSGIFSGLNLGLMSLDIDELKLLLIAGTDKERGYAKKIEPLRRRGNFLLCVLLLGNVLVNTTLTIFLDNVIGSGLQAVIFSTLGIVIFGEIVPQALCSRHGLAIGAHTVFLTYIFMIVTGVLAWPISKILDLVLGEEIGTSYNRDRLREMIRMEEKTDLQRDEVDIITGVLGMNHKRATDIMTLKHDVYMLDYNSTVLNFDTIAEIKKTGYTRIPIFESDKDHIVAILNVKDLCLLDPDDNLPLATVVRNFPHHYRPVLESTTVPELLQIFRKERFHLAPVIRRIENPDKDPYEDIVGIVTLEDVIEEIIGAEINDETDVLSDNREKRRLRRANTTMNDYKMFQNPNNDAQFPPVITEQQALAAFHYLSTMVEPFKPDFLSAGVLKRLIIKSSYEFKAAKDPNPFYLYQVHKAADFFVLILEGRVRVEIGREKQTFEAGPFYTFGRFVLLNADKTPISSVGLSPSMQRGGSASGSVSFNRVEHRNSMPGMDGLSNLNANNSSTTVSTVGTPAMVTPTGGKPGPSVGPASKGQQMALVKSSVLRPKAGSFSTAFPPFIPDYTVYPITDEVLYVKITRADYLHARKMSQMATLTDGMHGSGGPDSATASQASPAMNTPVDHRSVGSLGPASPLSTSATNLHLRKDGPAGAQKVVVHPVGSPPTMKSEPKGRLSEAGRSNSATLIRSSASDNTGLVHRTNAIDEPLDVEVTDRSVDFSISPASSPKCRPENEKGEPPSYKSAMEAAGRSAGRPVGRVSETDHLLGNHCG